VTLHFIESNPLVALGLVGAAYLHGATFNMNAGAPTNTMELTQSANWGSTLVLMTQGDQRAVLEQNLVTPLTLTRTVVGIGGRDDNVNSPLAASAVYDVRLVATNDGMRSGLIGTKTGNAPVLPVGYPWVSPVLFIAMTSGASLWEPLTDLTGGRIRIESDPTGGGKQVVSGGNVAASTPIDCSSALPADWLSFRARYQAQHLGAALTLTLRYGSTGSLIQQRGFIGNAAAGQYGLVAGFIEGHRSFLGGNPNPATAMYYEWSGVPTVGLTVAIQDIWIPHR